MTAPGLFLARLRLTNFRSWRGLDAAFDASLICIAGENGAGKTNLLEAISLLAPGRGLRGARMGELGRQEEGAGLAWAAAGRFETRAGPMEIGTGTDPEGATERRIYRLDGQALRSQAMLAERMAAVWITPQMDRLFQEGASGRRRFLDRLVWALEPGHAREVAAHDNAMAERNRLLAEGRADPAWLAGLEDAMARHAVAVAAARRALMLRLNAELAAGRATGAFPAARLDITCPITAGLAENPALALEDALRQGLAQDRRRDAAAGGAARGAHKADLSLIHMPKGISAEFCSTGEQKALLVSVVLAHASLIAEARGFAPLLLLDEVAAHLDPARREALFAALAALPAQVFMTGTDAEVFAPLAGIGQVFGAGDGRLFALR
ncbi:MAG: DNA replication/repair protein RecF [Roseomonas sp.]|nr:DNA replication/repair protein RecF [Roseomonas sp.]